MGEKLTKYTIFFKYEKIQKKIKNNQKYQQEQKKQKVPPNTKKTHKKVPKKRVLKITNKYQ